MHETGDTRLAKDEVSIHVTVLNFQFNVSSLIQIENTYIAHIQLGIFFTLRYLFENEIYIQSKKAYIQFVFIIICYLRGPIQRL